MKRVLSFFSEVLAELKKVTWPKRKDVLQLLGLVVAISAVIAIYVGGIDYGLTKLLENLVAN